MKISRGLSSFIQFWLKSLRFDLLYIGYHSRYDVDLETEAI